MARILLVDDHQDTLLTWTTILTRAGFEVSAAATGHAAVNLGSQGIDGAIIDLHLPDISGVDVVKALRHLQISAPLFIVTAFPDLKSSFDAGAVGANGFIEGPLSAEDIIATAQLAVGVLSAKPTQHGETLGPPPEETTPRQFTNGDDTVRAVLQILSRNPREPVHRLASQVRLSSSRLRYRFKAHVGVPLGRYVEDLCLSRAAALLRANAEPLKMLADRAGFGDESAFGRAFKRRFGLSPALFRRKYSQRAAFASKSRNS